METNCGHFFATEAMQKGTVYLAIWMYVIREMEDALDDCVMEEPVDSGVHSWDEAVAFYTGSLEGTTGLGNGVLMYALADARCQNFRTCGKSGDSTVGRSYVNEEVFREFNAGQTKLMTGDCVGAKENKDRIVQLMTVPLIQGTLRYAYLQDTGVDRGEKAGAEGATFAAAVLPFVYDCGVSGVQASGVEDSTIIYENLKVGHEIDTNFQAVKEAFERNYECMGITCSDVGGIWDLVTRNYADEAGPCGASGSGGKETKSGDSNAGLAIGLAVGGVALLGLIVIVSSFCGDKAAPPPVLTDIMSETPDMT
jgi:hypothetical protein